MEQQRAERISRRIEEYHIVLTDIYEKLVDRDFKTVPRDVQFLIMELRCILKSIEEDDF
jgi:hypothetical protein|tara:strand:+ start:333 stop:509 length:177 start_codon:yes stop_codon:yes gene_type:complete